MSFWLWRDDQTAARWQAHPATEETVHQAFEAGDLFQFSYTGWHALIALALGAGWVPLRDDEDYYLGRGPVTAEDARRLAAALTRALDDVPDHEAVDAPTSGSVVGLPGGRVMDTSWATGNPLLPAVSATAVFSGAGKAKLQAFIQFAESGGFTIH